MKWCAGCFPENHLTVFAVRRGFVRLRGPEVSGFDVWPLLIFRLRGSGGAVGALTTHIDGVLDCGARDVLLKVREHAGRRF